MNKSIFTAAIVLCLTISCSNPQQATTAESLSDPPVSNNSGKNLNNANMNVQKITPYLWVEKDAKAVAEYYLSIFKDGKLKDFRKFASDESGNEAGIETAVIEIAGMEFSILAAGPLFKFNEAVSFVINTKDQAETDYYWEALTKDGGEEGSCGWCKDKYGLSWQVVPTEYYELIHSDNPAVREKAMKNTLKQKKLILSELK
ncbi:MAG TPA: VOC family protein [Cyclobacteriaceae bacterium]|nr:VOC family protein [Cyclobacteriaceae bacterium]HMV89083.1 VOC family protein [Cyclobacteriaceae bacterium]HMX02058.1 VOC family protein [Cyclobacteriaceae bacterium]HMX49966.1 VOC family protein [Cyclobacteriaceae bacterium]HMY93795.1 VOC family protein [Cyclobacteriaceae bacterium]